MGSLLPLLRTTPTQADFARTTATAWDQVFPEECNGVVVSVLFAQYAWETGWGKSCWRWNLGNHRTGPLKPPKPFGYEGDYVELRTADEIINGKRVIVGGYFRAYRSMLDGALGHLNFLAGLDRYEPALRILKEATKFEDTPSHASEVGAALVEALKLAGYFTGPLDQYRSGVSSIASKYIATAPIVELFQPALYDLNAPLVVEPEYIGIQPLVPWYTSLQGALDSIFGADYTRVDQTHVASVMACRYDCVSV